ncbi:hypothetical protein [Agrobacterium sp.]|uniref:hypothetical protein n=1 Tax=Agrobacterium sp. TaxID=361 RepID=UPI0028ADDF19
MDSLLKPYWFREGELRDNVWHIHLADAATHSTPTLIIDFDQVISGWPNIRSLIDPEFEHDLITIKLVVLNSLAPGGWNKAPGSVKRTFSSHVAFVRWKIDRGITHNSSLSSAWFNEFDAGLKTGHREGLLNLVPQVEKVLNAVKSGELNFPLTKYRGVLSNKFANLIGLSNGSQLTIAARSRVERHFATEGMYFNKRQVKRSAPLRKPNKITTETAFRYYKVWLDLWDLKPKLDHDPIGYQAFKTKRALRRWMKPWVAKPEPTPDVPEYQAAWLINQSLQLVLDTIIDDAIDLVKDGVIAGNRIRNVEKLKQLNIRLDKIGLGNIGPYYNKSGPLPKAGEDIFLFHFLFVIALTAARVVTAAFSARRDEEVDSSLIDCIHEDTSGEVWLQCLIVKNIDRQDKVPVPKSVARAVEIVKKIRALGNRSGQRLYSFGCPISGRNVRFELDKRLDFARDYLNVPLLEDESAWHFTPHQFRKFFGVVYHWKWAFPNLTALTFHYRHFNSDSTRTYIELKAAEALRLRDEKVAKSIRMTDRLRAADFEKGKFDFVAWTLRQAISGTKIDGPLGRRIRAQVEALKQEYLPGMQLIESHEDLAQATFDSAINRLVETISIQVHPEGHSLCGCGGSEVDTLLSNCLAYREICTGIAPSAATGPDFEFAEDLRCLGCPHRGALPCMDDYWAKQVDLITRATPGASGVRSADLKGRMAIIEAYA